MKSKNFFPLSFAAGLLFATILSCNSDTKPAENEAVKTDSPVASAAPADASFASYPLMFIKHKVADYSKWKTAYDKHDSVRKAYGLSDIGVSRSAEDPNTVLIGEKISDLQKAKDFTLLPNLKEAMTKAGVTGKPEFTFLNIVRDESPTAIKDRVLITHRVKDFDTWLKAFDAEGKTTRAGEGMIDHLLARGIDDPNLVVISLAITDMGKAKTAIFSEAKKKIMVNAGVEGAPAIEFYKRAD
jgi:quinol monooxygenase YgiN